MSTFQLFNNVPFPTPIEVENKEDGNLYVISRKTTVVNTVNPYATSAFGETTVAQLSPIIQLQFPYLINSNNTIQFKNGSGDINNDNSQANLVSNTTPFSDAALASNKFITYQPGQGVLARFTAGFTTGNSSIGTFQQIGLGNQEDGFFFSYTDNDMNILIRRGGLRTQYSLKITHGATVDGNITLTLNGSPQNIPVSASDINTNAEEIGKFDFTSYNNSSNGDTVNIIAERTGPQNGEFSFSAGTTGMMVETNHPILQVAGVLETTTTINRANWSEDKCDGTGTLPLIDWSKGNVFQIKYQWLGYGFVSFYLEDPDTSNITLVNQYKYPNTNIIPSIANPSLQFLANVANASTTNNISMFVGSVGCFIEGAYPNLGSIFGSNVAKFYSQDVGNTFENIVSLRSPPHFKDRSNRIVCLLTKITVTASAEANLQILRNATLSGDTSWTSEGTDVLLESSQSVSVVTDGDLVYADRAEKQDRFIIEPTKIENYIIEIFPGNVITIAGKATSGGNSSISLAINWIEPI
jgi:hypothetical protein